ncbi:hypothetical protein BaRGS_00026047 [Batillaria attramentaria]|uniref:Glycoprotein-N-acetylgalactosamine 3-beta-galactosyltransferase 1 n=1 Tax=Batillaria attramentaria TaxID=370345 RepID=A0ABD0K6A1_9CAEN
MRVSHLFIANLKFFIGLVIGITASFVLMSHRDLTSRVTLQTYVDRSVYSYEQDSRSFKAAGFSDLHMHDDDDTTALQLAQQVRVLCWIMTSPTNLDTKAVHIRNTWGKRCTKLLFMSSKWNSTFPAIGLNVSEGRQHLTAKTMEAFRYVYKHHLNDADWFMKADDDTYVIMENLRYFLSSYNTEKPVYFGHVFKIVTKQGYASGGAGYILSKEALRRLATKGHNTSICRQDGGAEDAEVGKCFYGLGVKLLPTADRLGRTRFHCLRPWDHIMGAYDKWFYKYDANGARGGIDSLSDYAVSFHYISPPRLYEMEYFVYHLRPFGIIPRPQTLNSENITA